MDRVVLYSASCISQLSLEPQVERCKQLYFTLGHIVEVVKGVLGDIRVLIGGGQVLEEACQVTSAAWAAALVESGCHRLGGVSKPGVDISKLVGRGAKETAVST